MCAPPAVAALRESAGNLSDSAARGISPALSRDAATGIGSPALACAKRHLGQKPPRASPVSGAPHLRHVVLFAIMAVLPDPLLTTQENQRKRDNKSWLKPNS